MGKKIIISSDENAICPNCNHRFSLDQGIARHTIERYEQEFTDALASEKRELEESLAKEAERKANKLFTEQIAKLKEDLADVRKAEQGARALITKAETDAKAKATEAFAREKLALSEELAARNAQLATFREQELALRRQKQSLEEKQANFQVEFERKLDEERTRLASQIGSREAGRFALIEAEYKKKIDDAQKANEDLRRKLDQGSQQLQGEVLELGLEHMLQSAFFHDQIDEVKNGQRGGDVIQTVRTASGQVCGKIIWEAKRAENWSEKWLQKLKDDQQEANADIAVLVTTAMPKGNSETFCRMGDVWVVSPQVMRPVGETLRVILLEVAAPEAGQHGPKRKDGTALQLPREPAVRPADPFDARKFRNHACRSRRGKAGHATDLGQAPVADRPPDGKHDERCRRVASHCSGPADTTGRCT